MPDAQPVAPSATPTAPPVVTVADAAVSTGDQAAFKAARRAERSTSDASSADSSSDSPAAPATSTDVQEPAASEPAKGSKAKERSAQLDADIAGLQERLRLRAALREELARTETPKKDDQPASSAAAPTVPDHKRFAAMPGAPKLDQFDTIEEHTAALALFIADQRFEERERERQQVTEGQRRDAEQAKQRDVHARTEHAFVERMQAATTADPKVLDGVDPKLFELRPSILRSANEPITFGHVIADQLLQSPHPVQLLKHLSDPAEQRRLADLAPDALFREIGRIEAGFEREAAASEPKLMSSAPEPVTTLGKRPSAPADPLDAALKSGDQSAYKAAKQRLRAASQG